MCVSHLLGGHLYFYLYFTPCCVCELCFALEDSGRVPPHRLRINGAMLSQKNTVHSTVCAFVPPRLDDTWTAITIYHSIQRAANRSTKHAQVRTRGLCRPSLYREGVRITLRVSLCTTCGAEVENCFSVIHRSMELGGSRECTMSLGQRRI